MPASRLWGKKFSLRIAGLHGKLQCKFSYAAYKAFLVEEGIKLLPMQPHLPYSAMLCTAAQLW